GRPPGDRRLLLEPLLLALQQGGLGLVARRHRAAVGARELTGAAQQRQVAPAGGRGDLEVAGQVGPAGETRLSGARHALLTAALRLAGHLRLLLCPRSPVAAVILAQRLRVLC